MLCLMYVLYVLCYVLSACDYVCCCCHVLCVLFYVTVSHVMFVALVFVFRVRRFPCVVVFACAVLFATLFYGVCSQCVYDVVACVVFRSPLY